MVNVSSGADDQPAGTARVSAVAALDENRVIGGVGGGLPWHIPEDSRRFRALTAGHPLIMGRVTFEEFDEPLEDVLNIVVTRDTEYAAPAGCVVAHSLGEALEYAQRNSDDEIFVGGGAMLYRSALAFCDRLYLTLVHARFEGAARFPEYSEFGRVLGRSSHSDGTYEFEFVTLER
jgi:dihydrofolate reductase